MHFSAVHAYDWAIDMEGNVLGMIPEYSSNSVHPVQILRTRDAKNRTASSHIEI